MAAQAGLCLAWSDTPEDIFVVSWLIYNYHAVICTESDIKSSWTASSEFGTYRLCEQRRFRRACASVQSRQNLCCSLIQAVNQKEPSDRKPDPWPLWMARHAQLKFVMTEFSKTQIRLTGLSFKTVLKFMKDEKMKPRVHESCWKARKTLLNEPRHAKMCRRTFSTRYDSNKLACRATEAS